MLRGVTVITGTEADERRWESLACFLVACGSYWAFGINAATGAASLAPSLPASAEIITPWSNFRFVLLIVALLASKPLARATGHVWLPLASGALLIAGTWLSGIAGDGVVGHACLFLKAAGHTGIFLCWARYLARIQTFRRCLGALSGSSAIAFLELLVIGHIPASAAVLSCVLAALACAASCALTLTSAERQPGTLVREPAREAGDHEPRRPAGVRHWPTGPAPLSRLLGYVALMIPMPFYVDYVYATATPVDWSLVLLFALALTLGVMALDRLLTTRTYVLGVVSLLLLGMVSMSLLDSSVVSGSLIYAGTYSLRAYVFADVMFPGGKARASEEAGDPTRAIRLATVANLTVMCASMAGLALGHLATTATESSLRMLFVVATYAIFLGGYALVAGTRAPSKNADSGLGAEKAPGGEPAPSGEPEMSGHSRLATYLEELCAPVAHSHGLSERESEILVCLVRGKSVAAIAQQLTLSENTVKSHMNRMYKKLGVHSREELVELVERQEA